MLREECYKKHIEDIALEISQSNQWRDLLKNSDYNSVFLISKNSAIPLPAYIKSTIEEYDLKVNVSKIKECDEKFDHDLIIFMFVSIEFPNVVRFTGN